MRYTRFHVENFKGIRDLVLERTKPPSSGIVTLVGLNESGKTTVLESLYAFAPGAEDLNPLQLPGFVQHEPEDLIPIARQHNFTDEVAISAQVELDDDDHDALDQYLRKKERFVPSTMPSTLEIRLSFRFKDSVFVRRSISWDYELSGTKKRGSVDRDVGDPQLPGLKPRVDEFLSKRLPLLLYFPNFLADFPEVIPLIEPDDEVASQSTTSVQHTRSDFYRAILQDILDAVAPDTTVERHLAERAMSSKRGDTRSLEQLLDRMSNDVSRRVFDRWDQMFGRAPKARQVVLAVEPVPGSELPGIVFKIRDQDGIYQIKDRSLGFRWFFAYLLMTEYRVFRSDGRSVVFLLDEPASNLHPAAQERLRESFEQLADSAEVIYATHSQYLINPLWLENAYIVMNRGLDEGSEEDFVSTETEIVVSRYRDFVSKHPEKTSYFEPILQVLDYRPSELASVPNPIVVEGKGDFYILRYILPSIGEGDLSIFPGTGAHNMETLIALHLGWGRPALILLDGDDAGQVAKRRYLDDFGRAMEERIATLSDLHTAWEGRRIEGLVHKSDLLKFQRLVDPAATEYKKKQFHLGIQEALVTGQEVTLMKSTKDNFTRLARALRQAMAE